MFAASHFLITICLSTTLLKPVGITISQTSQKLVRNRPMAESRKKRKGNLEEERIKAILDTFNIRVK